MYVEVSCDKLLGDPILDSDFFLPCFFTHDEGDCGAENSQGCFLLPTLRSLIIHRWHKHKTKVVLLVHVLPLCKNGSSESWVGNQIALLLPLNGTLKTRLGGRIIIAARNSGDYYLVFMNERICT